MSTNNTSFGSIATTATYDADDSKFVNSSAIYWQNSSTGYYFRALAQKTDSKTLDAVTAFDVNKGTDLLWGTTDAHTGKEANGTEHVYAESAIINPRTGAVPLIFKHAMSNVVVELATSNDASAVDYSNATISISNLYTNGTINIADGEVKVPDGSTTSTVAVTVSGETIMVPQTIDTNAKLVINLHDNTDSKKSTTYSLLLKDCKDEKGNYITEWKSGNKYTYTIHLEKEAMKFRAMIEKWKSTTGSGKADLDWD
jgi:hypothetical protein